MSTEKEQSLAFFKMAKDEFNRADFDSVYKLAVCYICGYGTEQNSVKGAELLRDTPTPDEFRNYTPARPDQYFEGCTFLSKLKEIFVNSLAGVDLAIAGGWGYSIEDAIIIDPRITRPDAKGSSSFSVSLEPVLAVHRGFMESIVCTDRKLAGIRLQKGAQRLLSVDIGNGREGTVSRSAEYNPKGGITFSADIFASRYGRRSIDQVNYTITGYDPFIHHALVEEWKKHNEVLPDELKEAHRIIFESCQKRYSFDMFFDITNSIG